MITLIVCYIFAIIVTTTSAVVVRHWLTPSLDVKSDIASLALDERITNLEGGLKEIILLLKGRENSVTEPSRNQKAKKERTMSLSEELTTPTVEDDRVL